MWKIAVTPGLAMQGLVIFFGIAATAIMSWTIVTRPTLLRGLLSDAQGNFTVSRLQLLVAGPAAFAILSSPTAHNTGILAALGLSNLGYLSGKVFPIISRIIGGKP